MNRHRGFPVLGLMAAVALTQASCQEPSEVSPDASSGAIGSSSRMLSSEDAGASSWSDYRLGFTLRLRHGAWGGALVRLVDDDNYYRFRCKVGSGRARLERVEDKVVTLLAEELTSACKVEGDHRVVIEVAGSSLSVELDGAVLLEVSDPAFAAGGIALYGEGGSRQPCRDQAAIPLRTSAAKRSTRATDQARANGRDTPCPIPGPQTDNDVSLEIDDVDLRALQGDVSLLAEDFDDGGFPNWVVVDSNPTAPSRWLVIDGRITYQSSVGNAGWSFLRFAAGTCGNGVVDTGEACDGGGGCGRRCQPGAPCDGVDCSGLDGACQAGVCDEDSGECSVVAVNEGGACDDGVSCTHGDTCAAGECGGLAYVCDDGNSCTFDACNGDGSCSTTAAADGQACNDADDCSHSDACVSGLCAGTAYGCGDGNACTDDLCQGDGSCTNLPSADGTACTDGDVCTENDACTAGTCRGSVSVACGSPGPSELAPPLSQTTTTNLGDSVEFLYSGADPIQTGVAPGTIDGKLASVIRGRVIDRAGIPLAFARVSILDHPEFGQTFSRVDGQYDLVVNGGGALTLTIELSGYLQSQRTVKTRWQSWSPLDDIVLVALDSQVTVVDLSGATSGIQLAQGSVETDRDGSRQARVLFPQGTTATMTLADGSILPLSTLSVRATEYTVGELGEQAMPGTLPAHSGYTYAVELSVDEARAAGATKVSFSQPVPFYLENFLGFPVGGVVPTGYYDRECGCWTAAPNGRLVGVLSISAGMAVLDIDGSGVAADAAALAALGVTDAERARLASLYAPGQSLWRVPIDHFTPWDHNWPFGGPPEAEDPPQPDAPLQPEFCPVTQSGSVIACENRTLGEVIKLAGTPHSLTYTSARADGHREVAHLSLTGSAPPATLKRVEVTVEVAGRRDRFVYDNPVADMRFDYDWDGLDVYGRVVQGAVNIKYKTEHIYDGVYYDPFFVDDYGVTRRAFGMPPAGADILRSPSRGEIRYAAETSTSVGPMRGGAIAGWALDVHHRYDPKSRRLTLGDGSQRLIADRTIVAFAGNGTDGYSGDGGPATDAMIGNWGSIHLAFAPNGELYFTDPDNCVVRKVDAAGAISTVAGTGCSTADRAATDGGLATAAVISDDLSGIAIDKKGTIYLAEIDVVRKIDLDGVITLFAGQYDRRYAFDGIALPTATSSLDDLAAFHYAYDLSVDDACNLYVLDNWAGTVRRVGSDGRVTTIAGGGYDYEAGASSLDAYFVAPQTTDVDNQGRIYVASYRPCSVRRIGTDGIVEMIAGSTAAGCVYGDNEPVLASGGIGTVQGIAFGAKGETYIADGSCVRAVMPDGYIRRVAGLCDDYGRTSDLVGVPGPADQAPMDWITDMVGGPDGSLYVASNSIVYKVSSPLTGLSPSEYRIASANGRELYVFDLTGRHLETLDASTGARLHHFFYDADGGLVAVTDALGRSLTIERDASGVVTSIAPAALGIAATSIAVGADGLLSLATAADGSSHALGYSTDGLLQTFTDPAGNTSVMSYDPVDGRLVSDTNAAAGGWAIANASASSASRDVTMQTAAGQVYRYQSGQTASDQRVRSSIGPDGLATTTVTETDGSAVVTSADGTVMTTTRGQDPRFGMLSPTLASMTITTPGGRSMVTTTEHSVDLLDPNDPLSLGSLTTTAVIDGASISTVDDWATRTRTMTSAEGRVRSETRNALGMVVSAQDLGAEPVVFVHDDAGRVLQEIQGAGATQRLRTRSFSADGSVETATLRTGAVTTIEHDALGLPVVRRSSLGRVTQLGYNGNGRVTSVAPPGQPVHLLGYDAKGRQTSYTAPDVGAGSSETSYQRDLDGRLTQMTWSDGSAMSVAYDASGNLQSISHPHGVVGYGFDAATGQLTTITAPDLGVLTRSYDGFLPTGESWSGVIQGSVTRSHGAVFRPVVISVNGQGVNYAYDDDGEILQAGALAVVRDPSSGLEARATLGALNWNRSYSSFLELSATQVLLGTNSVYQETLDAVDNAGRIVQRTESVGGLAVVYGYEYDGADRLWKVHQDGALAATYSYDGNGNRTGLVTPVLDLVGSSDARDRLTSYGAKAFSYASTGHVTRMSDAGAVTTYDYDVLGGLHGVSLPSGSSVQYLLDGMGRRIGRSVDGVLLTGWLYDGFQRPVAELDGTGALVSRFVYGDSGLAPRYMVRRGTTYALISDHLGSVRLVVDVTTGDVAQRLEYSAFGEVLSDSNPGFQPFAYAGGLYDAATGLVRFGYRDYHAELGRWMAPDPIGFKGGDTNLYAYVANDPVNFSDISGLGRGKPWERLGMDKWTYDLYRENYFGAVEQCVETLYELYECEKAQFLNDVAAELAAASLLSAAMVGKGIKALSSILGLQAAYVSALNGQPTREAIGIGVGEASSVAGGGFSIITNIYDQVTGRKAVSEAAHKHRLACGEADRIRGILGYP